MVICLTATPGSRHAGVATGVNDAAVLSQDADVAVVVEDPVVAISVAVAQVGTVVCQDIKQLESNSVHQPISKCTW